MWERDGAGAGTVGRGKSRNCWARKGDVPISLELVIKRQLRARRDRLGGEKPNPQLPIHSPLWRENTRSYSSLNSRFAFPEHPNPWRNSTGEFETRQSARLKSRSFHVTDATATKTPKIKKGNVSLWALQREELLDTSSILPFGSHSLAHSCGSWSGSSFLSGWHRWSEKGQEMQGKVHSLGWEKATNTTHVGIISFPTLYLIFSIFIVETGVC